MLVWFEILKQIAHKWCSSNNSNPAPKYTPVDMYLSSGIVCTKSCIEEVLFCHNVSKHKGITASNSLTV